MPVQALLTRGPALAHSSAAMMMRAIQLSLRQLADARTLRLLIATIAITIALFAVLGLTLWLGLDRWVLPRWFSAEESARAGAAIGMAVLITLLSGWFLFRAVAMLVVGLFTDSIVESVEEDHYPAAAASATPVSFAAGLRLGLQSAGRAILYNLIAAPLYVLLIFTGFGTLAVMLIVNAILLSRDFEAMVMARHPAGGRGGALQPLGRKARWILGLATAGMFLIPLLSLLAPVFGAALAVHLFHMQGHKPA